MSCRRLIAIETLLAICFCILLLSCASHDRSIQNGQDSAGANMQNLENPKYDFERDSASTERIRANIANVKIGDSSDQVLQLLGPATSDLTVSPKTPEQKWKYRVLRYDIKRLTSGATNGKYDQVIVFNFDENDHEKLFSVDSTVPGISSRGTLTPSTR